MRIQSTYSVPDKTGKQKNDVEISTQHFAPSIRQLAVLNALIV